MKAHLTESESGYGGFKMEGKNSGATMHIIHTDNDLPKKLLRDGDGLCCSINIYVNNNIQGVNNSILADSQVKMKSPGITIYLDGLKLVERWNQERKRKKVGPTVSKRKRREDHVVKKSSAGSGSKLGLVGMVLLLGGFLLSLCVPDVVRIGNLVTKLLY